jgi:site-specific recombinase XerD
MEAYIKFQTASGRWNDTYEYNLLRFDCQCLRCNPEIKELTQKMVNDWCSQRDTEKNNSCRARIMPVLGFVRYLRSRNKTGIADPIMPQKDKCTYVPHNFTDFELEQFFAACDSLPSTPNTVAVQSRKITVPVFFRLLYSSGLRTNEARLLGMEDVDLSQGVISVRKSKGEHQHFVAMHETMLNLMRKYDIEISKISPSRNYFFPSPTNSCYSRYWVKENFRALWDKCSLPYAKAYDLRHNYAIENINQWIGCGFEFESRLLYLSKSMGHSTLESTRYYYSMTPVLADILGELSGPSFDDIVPEVDYD